MNKRIFWFLLTMVVIISSLNIVYANNVDTVKLTANLLNQDPDPAVPGEYLELRFNVYKTGNNVAENIEFNLNLEHPFYFDSSDTGSRTLSVWKGQSGEDWYQTIYYKVLVSPDALKGDYEVELRYRYNNLNIWNIQKFTLRVDEKKEPNFVFGNLTTTPRKLLSGTDDVKLDIELQNIGEGDSKNVTLEVILPEGLKSTYAYSNRVNLGTIESSQSKIASIYIDIDKEVIAKEYFAKIIINYQDSEDSKNEYKTKELLLSIPIKEKPYLKVIGQEILSEDNKLYAGNTTQIKINLRNYGLDDAKSVSLRVLKDSSHPFDFTEKSDFIGNLEVNEEGEAIVVIEIDEDAVPKKYKVNVEIRSIAQDTVFIDDDAIILEIFQKEKDKNSLLSVILIVVALLIIGYIGYRAKNKCKLECESTKNKKK